MNALSIVAIAASAGLALGLVLDSLTLSKTNRRGRRSVRHHSARDLEHIIHQVDAIRDIVDPPADYRDSYANDETREFVLTTHRWEHT